jgi:hypothetical protein
MTAKRESSILMAMKRLSQRRGKGKMKKRVEEAD